MFCRVVLNNVDDVSPWYSLDGATNLANPPMAKKMAVGIPPANQVYTWFIRGTVLDLRFPSTNALPGVIQMSETITEDVSYAFERGRWGRRASSAKDTRTGLASFAELVRQYLDVQKSNLPFVQTHTVDFSYPQDVVNEMYTFMLGYADWAGVAFIGVDTSGPSMPNATTIEGIVNQSEARLEEMVDDTTKNK